jgi:hypothetical protein
MDLIKPLEEYERVLVTGWCNTGMKGVVWCFVHNDREAFAFIEDSNAEGSSLFSTNIFPRRQIDNDKSK